LDFGNWTLAMGLEIGRFLGELGEFWAIGRFLDLPISIKLDPETSKC
jgi:hypothetical protein